MDNVEFEEEENYSKRASLTPKTPAIITLLLKYKIAKDKKTATYILFGGTIVTLLIAVIILI